MVSTILGTLFYRKNKVFYYKTVFRPLNKEYQTSHYGHNIHILGNIFYSNDASSDILFMNKYTAMLNLTCNLGNIPVVKGSISVPIDLFLNMKDCKIFPLILWMRRRLLIVTFKETVNLFNNNYTQHTPIYRMKNNCFNGCIWSRKSICTEK